MLSDYGLRIADRSGLCFSKRAIRRSSGYYSYQRTRFAYDSVNNPSEQVLSRTKKKALNYTLYHYDTFRSGSGHTREHIP